MNTKVYEIRVVEIRNLFISNAHHLCTQDLNTQLLRDASTLTKGSEVFSF